MQGKQKTCFDFSSPLSIDSRVPRTGVGLYDRGEAQVTRLTHIHSSLHFSRAHKSRRWRLKQKERKYEQEGGETNKSNHSNARVDSIHASTHRRNVRFCSCDAQLNMRQPFSSIVREAAMIALHFLGLLFSLAMMRCSTSCHRIINPFSSSECFVRCK